MITFRYRCDCTGNEILTINTVMDLRLSDDMILNQMRLALKDMRFEIKQHINKK